MTREEIVTLLVADKDKTKKEVLADFISMAVSYNVPLEKIGKMISDLKSYKEWIWE